MSEERRKSARIAVKKSIESSIAQVPSSSSNCPASKTRKKEISNNLSAKKENIISANGTVISTEEKGSIHKKLVKTNDHNQLADKTNDDNALKTTNLNTSINIEMNEEEEEDQHEVDTECAAKLGKARVFRRGLDVYDVMLNQTNIQNNNNKYFLLQLLEEEGKAQKYSVWFRWGRVGFKGQKNLIDCGTDVEKAIRIFSEKFFEKTRNKFEELGNFEKFHDKYDLIRIKHTKKIESILEYKEVTTKTEEIIIPECKLDDKIRGVMELISDLKQMEKDIRGMEYDINRCPLGSISKSQVKAGFEALSKIEKYILNNQFDEPFIQAMNDYYTKIPHFFGMKVPTQIRTLQQLKNEITLLETLSDIELAVTSLSEEVNKRLNEERGIHPLDRQYKNLKWSLTHLEDTSEIFMLISKYLCCSHGKTHSSYKMNVRNIFELSVDNELMDAENREFRKKIGNRMLLWHGSRMSNWFGILSQGLRIAPPEAPVTGYMFGKGVYFADSSSKSANYTLPELNKPGFMLLSEVALGEINQLYESDTAANKLPKGKNSVQGVGRYYPPEDKSVTIEDGLIVPCGEFIERDQKQHKKLQLLYNEFAVYNTRQIRERFLVEIEFNFDFEI